MTLQQFNDVAALGTIGMQFLIVVGVLGLLFHKKISTLPAVQFLRAHGLIIAAVFGLLAMGGSLLYSEVYHLAPCLLCWYQRVAMYPQVVILSVGYFMREMSARVSALILSVAGLLIGIYHYSLQIGVTSFAPCSTVGYSVSCSESFVRQYGYVTIPMMSITVFALIIVVLGYTFLPKVENNDKN
jgi:disulfide bond formation protein DsbB